MILWNIEDINSAFNMLHVIYYAQNWSSDPLNLSSVTNDAYGINIKSIIPYIS